MAKLEEKDKQEMRQALITRHNRVGTTVYDVMRKVIDRHIKADRKKR